ncbi:unnamed protein product [Amoebophrya sp. A25]|nr:unnamed protein product [Amoebophrya sp. A25]|eukprot:GSA25T00024590001.1
MASSWSAAPQGSPLGGAQGPQEPPCGASELLDVYDGIVQNWEQNYEVQAWRDFGRNSAEEECTYDRRGHLYVTTQWEETKRKAPLSKTQSGGKDIDKDLDALCESYERKKYRSTAVINLDEKKPRARWSPPEAVDPTQKARLIQNKTGESLTFFGDSDPKTGARFLEVRSPDTNYQLARPRIDLADFGLKAVHFCPEFGKPEFMCAPYLPFGVLRNDLILCCVAELDSADNIANLVREAHKTQRLRCKILDGDICFSEEESVEEATNDATTAIALMRERLLALEEARKHVDFGEKLAEVKNPVLAVLRYKVPEETFSCQLLASYACEYPHHFPCYPTFASPLSDVVASCYVIPEFPSGLRACLNRQTTDYFLAWRPSFNAEEMRKDKEAPEHFLIQGVKSVTKIHLPEPPAESIEEEEEKRRRGAGGSPVPANGHGKRGNDEEKGTKNARETKKQKTDAVGNGGSSNTKMEQERVSVASERKWHLALCPRFIYGKSGTGSYRRFLSFIGRRLPLTAHSAEFERVYCDHYPGDGHGRMKVALRHPVYGYHAQVQKWSLVEPDSAVSETHHEGSCSLVFSHVSDSGEGRTAAEVLHLDPFCESSARGRQMSQELLAAGVGFIIIQQSSWTSHPELQALVLDNISSGLRPISLGRKHDFSSGSTGVRPNMTLRERMLRVFAGASAEHRWFDEVAISNKESRSWASGALVLPSEPPENDRFGLKCDRWKKKRLGLSEAGDGTHSGSASKPRLGHILPSFSESARADAAIENLDVASAISPPRALVLVIHGGPHGVTVPAFNPMWMLLTQFLKCAVFFPNYSGSTSFSEEFVTDGLGTAGERDVEDCERMTMQLLERMKPKTGSGPQKDIPVFITGGSHGGFLTAHLIGRNRIPNIVAGIMRNPVTDMEAMIRQTDIPDWIFTEGLGRSGRSGPHRPHFTELSTSDCACLRRKSPVHSAGKVSCDVLMLLGDNDRRVPMEPNGKAYVSLLRRLRSSGTAARREVREEVFAGEGHGFEKENFVAKANLLTLEWVRSKM